MEVVSYCLSNPENTMYPRSPPAGSASPETNDQKNAFLREPVAKYTGTATAMPSGILCRAMARVTERAIEVSAVPAIKVANLG